MHPTVVAVDRIMQAKVALATRAAATDSSVLLLGESGVGKALFARLIHEVSARRTGPFEELNCAAVPPELLEAELFGRIARADGGTIVLDAVGDLPPELQPKLLGVLQHRRVYPAGGHEAQGIDTRIIAASDLDLEREVERGGFRRDLFYRLNVLPIYLPPLRERPDDVAALAEHFLKRCCHATGRGPFELTSQALAALRAHPWPGNVRELEGAIERAVVAADTAIEAATLSLTTALLHHDSDAYHGQSLKEAVRAYKRRFIRGALDSHGWNQTSTSRALEIQRTYLSRLIKELEISNR